MKNVSRKLILLLSCLILLSSFSPIKSVEAQETGTWVYFSPDPSYIYINAANEVTVNVMLRDAENISGFDVRVNFDPSIVSLESFAFGDFLTNVMCSNQVIGVDYIRLVCGQVGALPGRSGTGSLVNLVFSGVTEGTSPLIFGRVALSTADFIEILPGKTDGTLNVVNTANFQYLPLIMNVSIQGVMDRGGISVGLARGVNYGMGPYSGTSTDIPGNNLTIPSVVADTYRITTSYARVLNVTVDLNKTFTLAAGASAVSALRLRAGNAVWTDNVIDVHDLTAVNGAFGDPGLNVDADVNFDGAVDGRDLALVGGNWGLTSAMAYAGWQP
jgi:hypothetical protein